MLDCYQLFLHLALNSNFKTMKTFFFFVLLISIFIIGCEESSSSFSYEKQIVVNGLLESGHSIDSIKLSYTAEVDKKYIPSNYAITNAVVRVIGVDVIFDDTLIHDVQNPGRYYSADSTKIILPTKTYRLDIKTQDGKSVSATTTVPDTFSIVYSSIVNNSTVQYNTGLPVNFFSWTPSKFQGTYLPTISSIESAVPRIPKSYIRDTTSGPPPDKITYRVGLPKDQTHTELPWIVLNYYGKTRFDVFAIDENYNRFLNQFVASQGGELREIQYNISGGIGSFGSRTQAKGGITANIIP